MASLTRPRSLRAVAVEALPWACGGAAGIVVAIGLAVKAGGGDLGLAEPPFLMSWDPGVNGLAVVSVAAIAAALLVAPAIVERLRSPLLVAAALYLLALVLGLALNLAHQGASGVWRVFATGRGGSREGLYEYLPSLLTLRHGVPYFIGHFAALFPYFTVHVEGNPPGPLIALHLLSIHSAGALAALCIGVGALTAPLAYDLGRTLGGERRGTIAGVLTSFSPSMLLFGVTSADYAFAALGTAAACLLVRRSTRALLAGGCAAAFATFFSWLLFAIPAWAVLVAMRRDGWRPAARIALAAGLAIAAMNTALALAFGYDPLSAVDATARAYRSEATYTTRTYAFYLFGSPTAWGLMLGLPILWCGLRALGAADDAAIAVGALIVVASLIGLTKGETERIWLPFVPIACVAAAAAVPASRVRPILLLLAIQALTVELLFFTVW